MKRLHAARKAMITCAIAGLLVMGIFGIIASAKTKPKLNRKNLELKVGEKKKLQIKNTKKKVKWISNDKKIATVTQRGVVCGKRIGKTKIIAHVQKKKYVCSVTVKQTQLPQTSEPIQNQPTVIPQSDVTATQTAAPSPSVQPTSTPLSTTAASVTPTPVPTPNIEQGAAWEAGKKSGTKEDFELYFNLEMKQYTKRQKDMPQGKFKDVTYHSDVVGADREAYVYLPPNYDENKEYPVLYMLHGIGCDRGQWRYMSLNEILSNMINRGELQPLVAVLPSVVPKNGLDQNTFSSDNIGAFTMFEKEFLTDLEPYIQKNYAVSIKRENTGVCGLSMGGMEALRLGFVIKDHFNYIGSFSAAPSLDQSILNLDGWTTTPHTVLLCSGDADSTIGNNPEDYHKRLTENKVDHMWYLYPGGTHEEKVWKNGLVNFLKRSF